MESGRVGTHLAQASVTGIDLAEEDSKFMKYLADNGWDGEVGEDDDETLDDESSDVKHPQWVS